MHPTPMMSRAIFVRRNKCILYVCSGTGHPLVLLAIVFISICWASLLLQILVLRVLIFILIFTFQFIELSNSEKQGKEKLIQKVSSAQKEIFKLLTN
jgi:hypothetical protein